MGRPRRRLDEPVWEFTESAEDHIRRDPRFEEPDFEAPHGWYLHRRIIGRDTSINGGVYIVPGYQEAIVVDDEKYPRHYDRIYNDLIHTVYDVVSDSPEASLDEKILWPVYEHTKRALSYDLEFAQRTALAERDKKLELGYFIAHGKGVCRHQALLAGYLLERLKREKELMEDDQVSVDRNSIRGKGGHAWVRYTSSDGTVYIIDPAQRSVGKLADLQGLYWDYRRPVEVLDDGYEAEGKLIAEGAQYSVYDLDNGRMKKVPKTVTESVNVLKQWYKNRSDDELVIAAEKLISMRDRSISTIRQLVREYPEASNLFGNPAFENDGSFTQDYVKPLGEMVSSDDELARKAIDSYMDFVQNLWAYRVVDTVFNFQINYGAYPNGRTVLFDFGEIATDKQELADLIRDNSWQDARNVLDLPDELRQYFNQRAASVFTVSNLNGLWGSKT